jgi:hypothetical protein
VWKYYCYDNGHPDNLWSDWYHGCDEKTKAQHDQTWEILEQREPHQWEMPWTRHLRESLIEIRVRGNVEWRILGYFGPKGERKAFTVLLICHHKQKSYQPQNAIKTARKRLKEAEQNISTVKSCDRPS